MAKTFERVAAQGDILIERVDALPTDLVPIAPDSGHYIVAHSETGHHHVLDRATCEVYRKRVTDDPVLFDLFVKVKAPTELRHLRDFDTHDALTLQPGALYRIRPQREYTPKGFRRAAD